MLIQDYLDICDPVLTFDRFMGEIELEKYLKNIPQHYTGRLRYDPVSMLKTVLFGFMATPKPSSAASDVYKRQAENSFVWIYGEWLYIIA